MAATTMIIMATIMGTMMTHASTPSSELPPKLDGVPSSVAYNRIIFKSVNSSNMGCLSILCCCLVHGHLVG